MQVLKNWNSKSNILLVSMLLIFVLPMRSIAQNAFTVRLSSIPQEIDWNKTTSGSDGAVIQNIMEGLFRLNESLTLTPVLAQEFQMNADGTTLTIQIRKGVKWSDGKELYAQHFVDSFQRLFSPELNSPNAPLYFEIKNAKDYFYGKIKDFSQVGVKAIDTHKLEFVLAEPRPRFAHHLVYWPTFPIRMQNGKAQLQITLGPYSIQSARQDSIRLVSNPKYWDQKPTLTKVEFKAYSNGEEAIKAFENKNLDLLFQVEDSLLPQIKTTISEQQGKLLYSEPAKVIIFVQLNPTKVHSNSAQKRKNVIKALNLNTLPEEPTRIAATSILPPSLSEYSEQNSSFQSSPISWSQRISLWLQSFLSESLPSTPLILGIPNDPLALSVATQIQRSSKKLPLKIENLHAGNYRKYDLILTTFGFDYLDPEQLLSSFLPQGSFDFFNAPIPELPALLQASRKEKSYGQVVNFLQNEAHLVAPVYYRKRAFLLRSGFQYSSGAPQGSPSFHLLKRL